MINRPKTRNLLISINKKMMKYFINGLTNLRYESFMLDTTLYIKFIEIIVHKFFMDHLLNIF